MILVLACDCIGGRGVGVGGGGGEGGEGGDVGGGGGDGGPDAVLAVAHVERAAHAGFPGNVASREMRLPGICRFPGNVTGGSPRGGHVQLKVQNFKL